MLACAMPSGQPTTSGRGCALDDGGDRVVDSLDPVGPGRSSIPWSRPARRHRCGDRAPLRRTTVGARGRFAAVDRSLHVNRGLGCPLRGAGAAGWRMAHATSGRRDSGQRLGHARTRAGIAGAASGADAGLALDIAALNLGGTGSSSALTTTTHVGWRGVAGYEVRRLARRSPRLLWGLVATIVAAAFIPIHPTFGLATVCVVLVPALGLMLSSLRAVRRSRGLARALGLGQGAQVSALTAGAALAAAVWVVACALLLLASGLPAVTALFPGVGRRRIGTRGSAALGVLVLPGLHGRHRHDGCRPGSGVGAVERHGRFRRLLRHGWCPTRRRAARPLRGPGLPRAGMVFHPGLAAHSHLSARSPLLPAKAVPGTRVL